MLKLQKNNLVKCSIKFSKVQKDTTRTNTNTQKCRVVVNRKKKLVRLKDLWKDTRNYMISNNSVYN